MTTRTVFLLLACLLADMLTATLFAQEKSRFLRATCIKVNPGSWGEYEKLISDNTLKQAQYRIQSGAVLRFALSRAVIPGGEKSECDYLQSFVYPGFPPEITADAIAKYMKAGDANLPYEAYAAKLRAISRTVSVQIYTVAAAVGSIQQGNYLVLNRMKLKDRQDWFKLETDLWKPVMEARAADGQLTGWASYSLVFPGGTGQPFNAVTVDGYSSWNAIAEQKPLPGYVAKVHPNTSWTAFIERTNGARDLISREIYRVIFVAK